MTILFIDSVHSSLAERLTADGHECIHVHDWSLERIQLAMTDADGIVIRSRFRVDSEFLRGSSNLKFVARSGVGLENVDMEYCDSQGIAVFNTQGGNADAVGEHAIAMLLALFNKLHTADTEVRNGIWQREANRGLELGHRKVGIIGFGHTGKSLARKLIGFGCEIRAYDKYVAVDMEGVIESSLEEIQTECDVISFHVPLTVETRHYFDVDFLTAMRHAFYLVNTSRGAVVSTRDLILGLENDLVKGACLDVLEQEGADLDLSDQSNVDLQRLISNQKVLFSPHVAGWTTESYKNLADSLYQQIRSLVAEPGTEELW